MICRPRPGPQQTASCPGLPPTNRTLAYGRPFWMAYVANTLIMVALAILFRYADFISFLGGTELHLGWIVGFGMVGSLVMRLALGAAIDFYGARVVWIGALLLFSASCFAHPWLTTCHGPAVYLLRGIWCCGVAGIFGASMTFVSSRAAIPRIAEMIGMLGTAGFLGFIVGTQVGDWLLVGEVQRLQVDQMFTIAGSLGLGAIGFVWLATLGMTRPPARRWVPVFEILKRYQVRMAMVVGVASGVGIGLPIVFLRPFTVEMHISRIGLFFSVYAFTAIVTRIVTRRLPERFGNTPMILLGLGGLTLSVLSLLLVDNQWMLIVPGFGYGFSHAVLFPSMVAAGSQNFPDEHRGLATTLMFAMYDLGQLVGMPTAGVILHFSRQVGLAPYPTLFIAFAMLLCAVGFAYYRYGQRRWAMPNTTPVSGQAESPEEDPLEVPQDLSQEA